MESNKPINIFLVSNNNHLISPFQLEQVQYNIMLVRLCRKIDNALEEYKSLPSSIVVLELHWNQNVHKTTAEGLFKQLREHDPGIKVIGFTSKFEPDTLLQWQKLETWGYAFQANKSIKVLAKCIIMVDRGFKCFLRPKEESPT